MTGPAVQIPLTCCPVVPSLHVYLNGVEQYEPADWVVRDYTEVGTVQTANVGGHWTINNVGLPSNSNFDNQSLVWDQSSQGVNYYYSALVTGNFSRNGEGVSTVIYLKNTGPTGMVFRVHPSSNGYPHNLPYCLPGQTVVFNAATVVLNNDSMFPASWGVKYIDTVGMGGFLMHVYYPPVEYFGLARSPGCSIQALPAMEALTGDLLEARYVCQPGT